jgi:hypothetical protein
MNKHIDNIVKSIARRRKGLSDPHIMHPEREWTIGILLALIVFVLSATWSLTVYLENRNASADASSEEQSESMVYRETMVKQALTRIDDRAKKLKTLLPETQNTQEEVEEEIEPVATSTEPVVATSTEEVIEEPDGPLISI